MAFYPHTITAIAQNTTAGSNIVAGAAVSILDSDGNPQIMYDDAAGINGSTGKTTDSRGQVTIYAPLGEYSLTVNGTANGKFTISEPTIANRINVADYGYNGSDVEEAFNDAKALAGSIGDQYPSNDQVTLYFPSGRYNDNGSLITLSLGVTGLSIVGDGNTSQLDNIQIEMAGAARCSLSRFLMRGTLGYGIKSNSDVSDSFQSRQNIFSDLYIRDKTNGVILDGSTWNTWSSVFVEKSSGDGWVVTETSGEQISNCYSVSNSGSGVYITSGGELKFTNFLTMNNTVYGVHLYGTDSSSVVEHYFTNLTATGQQQNRTGTITNIVDSGGLIQVTSSDHMLATGMQDINISGTTNYNGSFNVDSVIDSNNFVLDASYVADETSGSFSLPNWDVFIESDSTSNVRVNDQFFTGGNINYTRIVKAFNIQFNGTRLKNQFYMDGGSSLINRTGMARGRNESTFSIVDASGDTTGLVEDIFGSDGGTAVGGDEIARRTVAGSSLTMDSGGVALSTIYSGSSGVINDDSVYSFTPQLTRGVMKLSNGAGQNARLIDLVFDTDTPNTGLAGYQGAVMELSTGVLSGTTGTDAKITVSAANDGKIYIENRSGSNQTMYWTIFR